MDSTLAEVNVDTAIWQRNIAALRLRNGWLAAALEQTQPSGEVRFAPSDEPGVLSATLNGKALASKRRPTEEARRWAESVDLDANALIVVHGFALGHHLAALAERCDNFTAILVVEPDLALLRAALARIDHAAWLIKREVRFVRCHSDVASLATSMRGLEAPMSFGVCTLVHPASAARLGETIEAFNKAFPAAIASARTHIITTLVQSDTTFRNALANAERYAQTPGIGALKDIAQGRLGVVVAAGPSLKRNVGLLKDPAVRSRCVVVAVQTVLKPLLAMGIRPDFVTAIDYAEISKRFYEGLTAEDVRGITLVSTGRANPAIPAAWPGALRMIDEEILSLALGPELAVSPDGNQRGALPNAATVAHLSYSLARYLGCDPVAMIGQDLAFTDGQYYADGAAIHTTWGGELNPFNTLEMLEWQRIVRMRAYLYRREDHLGRPVFTDEQMATYTAQFEQMFAGDTAAGLTVIDATEGGIAKQHCTAMPFADAIERYAGLDTQPISVMPEPACNASLDRRERVRAKLRDIRTGVRRIARIARDTETLLDRLERHTDDVQRTNRIVKQVHANRDEVHAIEPAWSLLQRLNQTAALKRFEADRRIARAEGLSEIERHKRRLERDRVNIRWMSEVGDYFDRILEEVDDAFDGRSLSLSESSTAHEQKAGDSGSIGARAWAVLVDHSGLSGRIAWERSLEPSGQPPIALLAERLARSTRLRGVAVITDRPDAARQILGQRIHGLEIRVIESSADDEDQKIAARAKRAARLAAPACWRSGVGGLAAFDEAFDAVRVVKALQDDGLLETIDAALIAGIDWCFLDPAIIDRMIAQHEESPEQFGIVFTQAVPGLAPVLLSRSNLEEFARGQQEHAMHANLSGVLGYVPTRPRPDPVGRANCLPLEGAIRDAGVRIIPDTARSRAAVRGAWQALGDGVVDADGSAIARAASRIISGLPSELVISTGAAAVNQGAIAAWYQAGTLSDAVRAGAVSAEGLNQVLASLGDAAGDLLLTIGLTGWRSWVAAGGCGHRPADPLDDDRWRELVEVAKHHSVGAIHLRTDASRAGDARKILDAGVDIVSVDAWANDAALYEQLTGCDSMRTVFENIGALLDGRRAVRGVAWPWIVPRLVRCDATYETIEAFYDKWLMLAGAAAIDPLPTAIAGQRIAPLTLPGFVNQRLCSERMILLGDGCVARDDGVVAGIAAPSEAVERWGGLIRDGAASADSATGQSGGFMNDPLRVGAAKSRCCDDLNTLNQTDLEAA